MKTVITLKQHDVNVIQRAILDDGSILWFTSTEVFDILIRQYPEEVTKAGDDQEALVRALLERIRSDYARIKVER